jgi:hypothetical protein
METTPTTQAQYKEESVLTTEGKVGYFLLIPPLLSVLLFTANFLDFGDALSGMRHLSAEWTGDYGGQGGGYTSAAPIYLGLMAIAGAMLIKNGRTVKRIIVPQPQTGSNPIKPD